MGLLIIFSSWLLLFSDEYYAIGNGRNAFFIQTSLRQSASLRSTGEYEEAVQILLPALIVCRHDKTVREEGRCLFSLAVLYWTLGDISESSRYLDAAQSVFKLIGDTRSENSSKKCLEIIRLYKFGKADRDANLNSESLKRFEQAINIGREIGLAEFEVKCLRQRGFTYWRMGEIEHFVECNKRGLEIARRINHKIETGRCLNNIGVYYQKLNNYTFALKYYAEALSLLRAENDQATEAECLSNTGMVYRDLGNLTKALVYLCNSLELDKKNGEINSITEDLDNIGSIYLRRGLDSKDRQDLLRALEVFEDCLALRTKEKISATVRLSALNNMGIIYSELDDFSNARECFFSAQRIADSGPYVVERCHIQSNIAASYFDESNIFEAKEYYEKAIELGSNYDLENAIMEASLGLGQCYERMGDHLCALSFYKRSIELLENLRGRISTEFYKIGFMRNKYDAYQKAIDLCYELYSAKPSTFMLEEIFKLIEGAKSRIFLDSVMDARNSLKNEYSAIFKAKETEIEKNISLFNRKLNNLDLSPENRARLINDLEAEEEAYFRLRSEMEIIDRSEAIAIKQEIFSIRQLQSSAIDGMTGILEYFLGEKRSYLVFITKNKAKLVELPDRKKLGKSLKAYLKLISSSLSDKTAGIAAARRIGREIIPLIENKDLLDLKSLIIIPDGILHSLPFETIGVVTDHPFSYLIENLMISYCPSVSSLIALKRPSQNRGQSMQILAVGGAKYSSDIPSSDGLVFSSKEILRRLYYEDGFRFSLLPFSKKEVIEVGKYFPDQAKEILIGKWASEENLKKLPLEMYKIMHFACHALVDEKMPFRSALVLSFNDEQEDDGLLQMREIYNLNLNADLVVLSACQTGSGTLLIGEGPIGLTRAFFCAGARSVISSLWPINDKITVVFMKDFYKNLIKGHTTSEALQITKKKMLKSSWAHPSYWAGFILTGNPTNIIFRR